jgi:hypothetical protein
LGVVETIVVQPTTANDNSEMQIVVNGVVNGTKTEVNPASDQKETARKSADLRAV